MAVDADGTNGLLDRAARSPMFAGGEALTMAAIRLKRVYERPSTRDGIRFLSHDMKHNNAVALLRYLRSKLRRTQ